MMKQIKLIPVLLTANCGFDNTNNSNVNNATSNQPLCSELTITLWPVQLTTHKKEKDENELVIHLHVFKGIFKYYTTSSKITLLQKNEQNN